MKGLKQGPARDGRDRCLETASSRHQQPIRAHPSALVQGSSGVDQCAPQSVGVLPVHRQGRRSTHQQGFIIGQTGMVGNRPERFGLTLGQADFQDPVE